MDAKLEEEENKPHLYGIMEKRDQHLLVMNKSSVPWLTGVELLEDTNKTKRYLPTGIQGIDATLGGGLREGQLIEIAGPSSSGKTQVCLHSATNIIDKEYGYILYLDTCNSFSPNRIAQLISQLSPVNKENERRIERIMSNIHYYSIYDIFTLLDFLHQLELGKHNRVKIGGSKLCLLIIDSISSLIAPILGGKNSQGRSVMTSLGIILKKIAHEHNFAILVTNHMVGGEMGALKPALGETWKNIPHIRILLGTPFGTKYHTPKILKHTLMVSNRTGTDFVIKN